MGIDINCDMGEAYSIYSCGDDEAIMPYITSANVACGFHASDPGVMHATVVLAKKHGVKVGAHPSFPDRDGFGRRYMKMERKELRDAIIYQVGALKGFLDMEGMALNHLKPHGALYGAAWIDEDVATACAEAAQIFGIPMYGTTGTMHETIWPAYTDVVWEIFADLDYDDEGRCIITREHKSVAPEQAVEQIMRVVRDGVIRSVNRQGRADQGGDHLRPFGHAERSGGRQGRARGGRPLYRKARGMSAVATQAGAGVSADMRDSNSGIVQAYRAKTPGSAALAAEAREILPSGIVHDARHLEPYGIYVTRAEGSRKWDRDGNEYVDFAGGHGALLLGHGRPEVLAAIGGRAARRHPSRRQPRARGALGRRSCASWSRARRAGALHLVGHRGDPHGAPPRPRPYRQAQDRALQGPLPRLARPHDFRLHLPLRRFADRRRAARPRGPGDPAAAGRRRGRARRPSRPTTISRRRSWSRPAAPSASCPTIRRSSASCGSSRPSTAWC